MVPRFRVWDKKHKEMKSVIQIEWDMDSSEKLLAVQTWPIDIYSDREGRYKIPKLDSIEIMMSTGLKDKNGREIFEGDIVVIPESYPFFDKGKRNYIGIVEWVQINSAFEYILKCVNNQKHGISDGINESLSEIHKRMKIIGNEWENPELLSGGRNG